MELTEKHKLVLQGLICPYCGRESKYVDSKEVYGENSNYGMIFICRPCDAYVGVHYGFSGDSKGRLANKELRCWKKEAHEWFDKLWKFKPRKMTRPKAYQWLGDQLKTPAEYTHIGMFGVETCKKVVQLVKDLLK